MKMIKTLGCTLLLFSIALFCSAGEEVDRLLEQYSKIETVTCQMRRIVDASAGKVTFISRVYYTNKGQIHAENLSPIKRRTISDGKILHQYAEGAPKGFSRPVNKLSEKMRISLFKVPGTAMDHLLLMKGKDEKLLSVGKDGDRTIGVDNQNRYAVMKLDAKGKLTGIEFYESSTMKHLVASYTFSSFKEVIEGVWVPFVHKCLVFNNEQKIEENIKVDRFIVNKPIAESLFNYTSFFDKNIDFVDKFSEIYSSEQ